MMLSQFTQALSDAKRSVRIDSTFIKGYIRISKCSIELGDVDSAQRAIDKAVQVEPNNALALQEKTSIQKLLDNLPGYLTEYNQEYNAKNYKQVTKSLIKLIISFLNISPQGNSIN